MTKVFMHMRRSQAGSFSAPWAVMVREKSISSTSAIEEWQEQLANVSFKEAAGKLVALLIKLALNASRQPSPPPLQPLPPSLYHYFHLYHQLSREVLTTMQHRHKETTADRIALEDRWTEVLPCVSTLIACD